MQSNQCEIVGDNSILVLKSIARNTLTGVHNKFIRDIWAGWCMASTTKAMYVVMRKALSISKTLTFATGWTPTKYIKVVWHPTRSTWLMPEVFVYQVAQPQVPPTSPGFVITQKETSLCRRPIGQLGITTISASSHLHNNNPHIIWRDRVIPFFSTALTVRPNLPLWWNYLAPSYTGNS